MRPETDMADGAQERQRMKEVGTSRSSRASISTPPDPARVQIP
jgi:hypothetical protein